MKKGIHNKKKTLIIPKEIIPKKIKEKKLPSIKKGYENSK